ncbi:natural resistance-associated macrophage protein-domain-containing protein [Syncephalis fuscata]|nr:natural resistance-associated macrophage protein-domain-containing protein [Syncephalis fuscata]
MDSQATRPPSTSGQSRKTAHSITETKSLFTPEHSPLTHTLTHSTVFNEKPDDFDNDLPIHTGRESLFQRRCKFLTFVGPGYLIAVGYMDPGNWATDLAAGSKFGYSLLTVIFFSNIAAVILQMMSVKLGVVTGMDLARMCREEFRPWLNWVLYIVCELAIIATDLAEVIGSAIALDLLFGLPLPAGVVLMGLDVLILLMFYRQNGTLTAVRMFEWLVIAMVTAVGVCFAVELAYVQAPAMEVLRGFLPEASLFTEPERIYLAMGIVGATVMPHNLYLHSSIVQAPKRQRRPGYATFTSINAAIKFTMLDCVLALCLALFINAAILIVGAGGFHDKLSKDGSDGDPADLYDAYHLIGHYLGTAAAILYAVALFIAGQSSTLTATLTGQIVMEGFVGMTIRPWLRRLVTRSCAIIPALIVAIIGGRSGVTNLLVISQVALSVQLPFAMIPLIWFTSSKRIMRPVGLEDDSNSQTSTRIDRPSHEESRNDNGKTADMESTAIVCESLDDCCAADNNSDNITISKSTLSPKTIKKEASFMSAATKVYGSLSRSATTQEKIEPEKHFANSMPLCIAGGVIAALLVGLNIYMLIGIMRGEA